MKTPDAIALALLLRSRAPEVPPHHIAADVATLSRAAARATPMAAAYCNGALDSLAYERRAAALKTRTDETLAPYGLVSSTTGDPRGYCLRLFPAIGAAPVRGNTWGGDDSGYGI